MPQKHLLLIKLAIFFILSLPAVQLLWAYQQNTLGVNPYKTMIGSTGEWSFICLFLSLMISSLRRWLCLFFRALKIRFGRRLSDWSWLIRCRRMVGLFCFFYASAHFFTYLTLDIGFDWTELGYEISDRPFIVVGFTAWLLLVALAITSPTSMMRKMGKYWRQLHRSIYAIVLLACLHFFWLAKVGDLRPTIYLIITVILLLDRLLFRTVLKAYLNDDGMEAKR